MLCHEQYIWSCHSPVNPVFLNRSTEALDPLGLGTLFSLKRKPQDHKTLL